MSYSAPPGWRSAGTTIMVDELRGWPGRCQEKLFGGGRLSCHLTCEGDLAALHAFAERIGLKREWFQDHPSAPHYDLTARMRARALQAGATFVPARDQAIARRKKSPPIVLMPDGRHAEGLAQPTAQDLERYGKP